MPFRFNGASKSILCQEDEYLLELVWYIEDGFNMGRREDLTGGGLRRSAGGWEGVLGGIVRYFGISRPSVSQAIKRVEKFAKENDVKLLN
jgi:hypothetical protein